MCSPPTREAADQDALWQALALGDLQTVTSDHAPYRLDETGKLAAGPNPTFKQIANGMPGLETRLPLLFDALVSRGRPEFEGRGLESFVQLTATAPASIYNLPGKGALLPGYDADIAIWDPERTVTISDDLMHDRTGFTPFPARSSAAGRSGSCGARARRSSPTAPARPPPDPAGGSAAGAAGRPSRPAGSSPTWTPAETSGPSCCDRPHSVKGRPGKERDAGFPSPRPLGGVTHLLRVLTL